MKKLMMAVTTLALVAMTVMAAGEKPLQSVPLKARKVAMVNAAGLDAELMERVVAYVEKNLRIDVEVLPDRKPVGAKTLDAEAVALKEVVPSPDHCLVALVSMAEDVKTHGSIRPGGQVAALNATVLKPSEDDAERYSRRLEKESIRCVGLLAGMPPCVSPRCALWHEKDAAGLDRKGRNLCPPCYLKYQAILKAAAEDDDHDHNHDHDHDKDDDHDHDDD